MPKSALEALEKQVIFESTKDNCIRLTDETIKNSLEAAGLDKSLFTRIAPKSERLHQFTMKKPILVIDLISEFNVEFISYYNVGHAELIGCLSKKDAFLKAILSPCIDEQDIKSILQHIATYESIPRHETFHYNTLKEAFNIIVYNVMRQKISDAGYSPAATKRLLASLIRDAQLRLIFARKLGMYIGRRKEDLLV